MIIIIAIIFFGLLGLCIGLVSIGVSVDELSNKPSADIDLSGIDKMAEEYYDTR
jgi:hypothetical protein